MNPTWESDCGTVKLWLGDCLEVIATWPDGAVDAVVTDPPYGIKHASNRAKSMRRTAIIGDDSVGIRDSALAALSGVPSISFGSWKRPRPHRLKAVLIWDKGGAVGMGDLSFPWKESFEEIHVRGKGFLGRRGGGVLRHVVNAQSPSGVNGDGWLHPHEKPIQLLIELVGKCPGETIADPFLGSGTTGVAAVRLGRKFWGVEIDPQYFEVAKRRIQDELDKVKFLEPQPTTKQQELFA